MDDHDVILAFVEGNRRGQGPTLTIAGDALYLDGWWQGAFRLSGDAVMVQSEPPPEPSPVVDDLRAVLRRRGLREIPGEHPLTEAVAYAELTLAGVEWELWAVDEARANAALAARANHEPGPEEWATLPLKLDVETVKRGDMSAEFAAAIVDGMPRSTVLAVGLDEETVEGLEAVVPDCLVESRQHREAIGACGIIVPHLVVVDATEEKGRRFLLEFRAEACGRVVPVAALTADGEVPPGANVALDPAIAPAGWQDQLVALLP